MTNEGVKMNNYENMVDERFEFLSLLFKLAGHRAEYNDSDTEYQKEILDVFAVWREHPAVAVIKNSQCSYDRVFKFALHIVKNGEKFVFDDNIDSLYDGDRWLLNKAETRGFLDMCNVFYVDSDYHQFFVSRLPYYQNITKRFVDEWYSHIDFEWFRKYVDLSNLKCILSPSDSRHNYAAQINDKIYCLVRESGGQISAIHEYCHSFANPIASRWYAENPKFRKWCDDSVGPIKLPSYGDGLHVAYEYVTRAYTILHFCQSTSNGAFYTVNRIAYRWNEAAPMLMMGEFHRGFKHIQEVYDMVLRFESGV